MNREEILEKSRLEHQGKDIAGIETAKSGTHIGWIVTTLLAILTDIVDSIVFGKTCYELLFAISAGFSVVFICKYRTLRKKHELFVAVCHGIAAICWMTLWVLQIINR